ncbi:MAG: DUF1513 domain-containing protein [Myxococcaceae bacterium]|nr:DUF1513 domain-containing protein [Myxococcaceae bacterium]
MAHLDRRTLLSGMAALSAVALLPQSAEAAKKAVRRGRKGVMVGGLKGLDPTTRQMVHALTLIDLDAPTERRSIPLTFLAHGFALDPRNPNRAIVFEKRGPGAAEVELKSAKFMRPLKTTPERAFYGHGVFSKDGTLLFVTENHLATRKGLVSVWDGRTLAPMGEFPTYGENPHDILLTPDGKQLVVTNGGGAYPDGDAPCVTVIDIATRQLLEKNVFTDPRINAGHVQRSARGELVVVSAPRDGLPNTEHGAVSIKPPNGKLTTLVDPVEVTRAMTGESLSLTIHDPTRRVMVTNPDANLVTVWDLSTQKFVKSYAKPKARGVMQTLDRQHYVICHGQTATVSFVSTRTLEEVPELQIEKSLIAGSHIFAWDGVLA